MSDISEWIITSLFIKAVSPSMLSINLSLSIVIERISGTTTINQ